jgi:hypothetical protein
MMLLIKNSQNDGFYEFLDTFSFHFLKQLSNKQLEICSETLRFVEGLLPEAIKQKTGTKVEPTANKFFRCTI